VNGQILAEQRDSILHVSIERPEKRNALDEAMF
jgi:enoyl-CoA hydratase/carnithine racemase